MMVRKSAEKTFKMLRRVEGGQNPVLVAGTAHFFPYSFRTDITRYVGWADYVLLEGPLDAESMQKVAEAGRASPSEPNLLDMLSRDAVARLERVLMPVCLNRVPSFFTDIRRFRNADPIYEMIRGIKPWRAFFKLWGTFLRGRGWTHSVDLEIYRIAGEMGKPVGFLETIEEQIAVLENLPVEKFIGFLTQADQWPRYAEEFIRHYLAGDPKKLMSITTGFPSRRWDVIEQRDRILFERMRPYIGKGRVFAGVGAPHLPGMCMLFAENGFRVECLEKPLRWTRGTDS